MKSFKMNYMRVYGSGLLTLTLASFLFFCNPKEETIPVKTPKKVLILGNSITWHPPGPDLKWFGNWGMAATAADKDFLSLLTKKIKENNEQNEVLGRNVYPFERTYETIKLSEFEDLKDFKADIIIIRFGENISETERAATPQLQVAVKAFVDYLADGRPVKVILTTPFWSNPGVNQNFLALSEQNKWPLIPLHDLSLTNENMALERFENISVGSHPGDLGMERIASRIWTVLANEL
uniref:SGNH/GDSL hydrolase family protein n=3 Tax=Algoriphagus sp. TaxID=1872435 RepID=UPI004048E90B